MTPHDMRALTGRVGVAFRESSKRLHRSFQTHVLIGSSPVLLGRKTPLFGVTRISVTLTPGPVHVKLPAITIPTMQCTERKALSSLTSMLLARLPKRSTGWHFHKFAPCMHRFTSHFPNQCRWICKSELPIGLNDCKCVCMGSKVVT